MKQILITGANSYIGTSLEKWLAKVPDKYNIDTIDMIDGSWREQSFEGYDVVFHVAGIAHVSCDPKLKELYYKVNRDLTIEVAEKARKENVDQFIFMSSIIVYGDGVDRNGLITDETIPKPKGFYGDSKLQAEKGLQALAEENFSIAIVRPPMIYGKGSKGNYPRLSKLAQNIKLFPMVDNHRSMLHIDNLCEFIKCLIEDGAGGIYYPQNREYVQTSLLVKTIASSHDKPLCLVRGFGWILKGLSGKIDILNKVFGNLVYDKHMSDYQREYCVMNFEESIVATELEHKVK